MLCVCVCISVCASMCAYFIFWTSWSDCMKLHMCSIHWLPFWFHGGSNNNVADEWTCKVGVTLAQGDCELANILLLKPGPSTGLTKEWDQCRHGTDLKIWWTNFMGRFSTPVQDHGGTQRLDTWQQSRISDSCLEWTFLHTICVASPLGWLMKR